MLHQLIRVTSLGWALIGSCAMLTSCGDYHDHGCYGCGNFTPTTEFSNGVVSADLMAMVSPMWLR